MLKAVNYFDKNSSEQMIDKVLNKGPAIILLIYTNLNSELSESALHVGYSEFFQFLYYACYQFQQ